ncbi:IS1 family transposase [Crocosphaera chwakensis]|uniref:Uncharacterized protein n=1 Tax=Crocosphaera chwakensis CCY0110 TaxID=391612 RepID=A3IU60_9CHRO|nr:IS1 family transposase [Crocosphaera chwakensis]EAZ90034.1 hypothetical protein CY0110_20865 [Crocosphaera chwakensis CCY0110]
MSTDHETGTILAYVLGQRKDQMFLKLKRMLKPFGINKFYTDNWEVTSVICPMMREQLVNRQSVC